VFLKENYKDMTTTKTCLLNGIILLALGFWGYAANQFAMHTGIVPIGFGAYLCLISTRHHLENKSIFYFNMGLTLSFVFAMIQPLMRNIEQADPAGICRVSLEMAACAMAVIVYIRSFKSTHQKEVV